jgi:predicted acetyltransferase
MKIEIKPAWDRQAVIRNLFALYAHDLSEMIGLDIGDDGSFGLPRSLAEDWKEPDPRFNPFLIRVDDKLAGFAMVRQLDAAAPAWDMAEFFILRKFRKTGLGRHVACALFDTFNGDWEVRELIANIPAQAFWRRIIGDYTGGTFDDAREYFDAYKREFIVQRFHSR